VEINYSEKSQEDIDFWIKTGNMSMMKKITSLIEAISISPFNGIGKPEPLKHNLTGYWSRRINKEHRVIYSVFENEIKIHSLRGHY
jgi:toxin YoeB